jgi:serine phosphatase RsbU (regulator of sigma subunit)
MNISLIGRERWLRLAGFLLALVFPLFGSVLVLDRFLAKHEKSAIGKLSGRMGRDYYRFRLGINPREMLCRGFSQAFRGLRRQGFTKDALTSLPRLFPEQLGVEIAGFSRAGELIVPAWATLSAKYAVKRMWEDMASRKYDEKRVHMYRTIFGPGFFPWDAEDRQGYPFLLVTENGDGTLLFRREAEKAGLLMFIRHHPPEFNLVRHAWPMLPEDGLRAVYHPGKKRFATFGTRFPGWQQLLRSAPWLGSGTRRYNGQMCRIDRHEDGFWVLRSFPAAPVTTHGIRTALWLMAFMLFPLGFRFWYAAEWSPIDRMKTAPRLLLFFVLAILPALAFLLTLGLAAMDLQKQTQEESLHEQNLTRLRNLDLAWKSHQDKQVAFFRRLRDGSLFRGKDSARITAVGRRMREKRLLAKFETHDETGKSIAKIEGSERYTSMILGMFSREALKRYRGLALPTGDSRLNAFTLDFLRSPSLDFTDLFDEPDHMRYMASGRLSGSWWYWDLIPPAPGLPAAFIFFLQYHHNLLQNFLKTMTRPDTFLFHADMRQWQPRPRLAERLAPLVRQAQVTHRPGRETIDLASGKRILATAFPSTVLKGCIFVTLADLGPVEKSIAGSFWELLFLMTLVMVLTVVFSRLLSESFLEPIRAIAGGIRAMENRRFSFRLQATGGDEFAELASTLNQAMEGMSELDAGREVQQNLVPIRPPDIPGYDVAFHTQSAADLGGDYLDCFAAGERFYVLTGDVSGHGVGSALLMAMAKAVCTICRREKSDFVTYLHRLQTLLHEVVQERKLMSLAMGALNPETHDFEWVSLGHPYPILRGPTGELRYLEMPHYPLGVAKKNKWSTKRELLPIGATVVFYTDGLIEARNGRGEFFDYQRLETICRDTAGKSARETLAAILAEFHRHTDGVILADDVTLLILRRTPPDEGVGGSSELG